MNWTVCAMRWLAVGQYIHWDSKNETFCVLSLLLWLQLWLRLVVDECIHWGSRNETVCVLSLLQVAAYECIDGDSRSGNARLLRLLLV